MSILPRYGPVRVATARVRETDMHTAVALAALVAAWNVPAPDKIEHSGAKAAPATATMPA